MNYVRSSKKTNKKRLSSAKRKRKGMDPPRRSAKGRRDPDAETRPARDSQRPDRPDRVAGAHRLSITRTPSPAKMTARVGQICRQFGVNPNPEPIRIVEDLVLRLEPGTITLISGPSGSGKSAILQALEERCPRAHAVHRAALPVSKSIVDAVGSRRSLGETLQLLTACALGEPRLWLRQYDQLSEGEQFRARLAWCIDHHLHDGSSGLLLCDEFCAVLHRRAARSIAYNLRKLTTRLRLTLIVATCSPDVAADLQPDVILQLHSTKPPEIKRHKPKNKPISLRRNVIIERAGKRDYLDFKPMHYRQTDELGFVDCVFVLREKRGGEKLAIVVYSYSPLELSLRNLALDGRFKRKAKLLNKEMRILRRLVVHPDVRGCGLGHYLVRKTLPLVGVPYVECLASMGRVNPVFERAGMARIGECPMPAERAKLLRELETLGADPFGADFVNQVVRRPRVRRVVAKMIYQWYQATTGEGEKRVARQSPQFLAQTFRGLVGTQPVYYLWRRPQ